MTFPSTIPAQGEARIEDGQLFQVVNGKWKKRPTTVCVNRIFDGNHGWNLGLVEGIDSFRAINRIAVDVAVVPAADTHVQINFRRHSGVWLNVFNDYKDAAGHLEVGSGRWRDEGWAMGHQAKGYYISWNKSVNEKLHADFCHWVHIDLIAVSDYYSLLTWDVLGRNVASNPFLIQGAAVVHEHPKNLDQMAFNANADFHEKSMYGELS